MPSSTLRRDPFRRFTGFGATPAPPAPPPPPHPSVAAEVEQPVESMSLLEGTKASAAASVATPSSGDQDASMKDPRQTAEESAPVTGGEIVT